MPVFEEAPDFQEIAARLVAKVDNVAHVDLDDVLFFREHQETGGKFLAKCYKFGDHPIGFFTDKRYGIVVYWAKCDYMTPAQLALLLCHEMMHIPAYGDKLVDHDVKDFRAILGVNLDWHEPGAEIPDISV